MMLLQIYFSVTDENTTDFEKMYEEVYVPALRKQQGYIRSSLLRIFPPAMAQKIQAKSTDYNYQMMLMFDTEENRLKWVDSPEHRQAWPAAEAMTQDVAHRAYDLVRQDIV